MKLPVNNGSITKLYGTPPAPGIKYRKGYHSGLDVVSADLSLFAVCESKVLIASYDNTGWGYYIIIRSADGKFDIIYAHLSRMLVKTGDELFAGQLIGKMGESGQTRGIHCHLEFRIPPWEKRNDIDPAKILGIKNKLGKIEMEDFDMDYAILKNSRDEDEMAERVSAHHGGCAVFLRKEKGGTYNPDYKKANVPITIGGPPTNLPGEIHLSGKGWEETSIAVAKYLLTHKKTK